MAGKTLQISCVQMHWAKPVEFTGCDGRHGGNGLHKGQQYINIANTVKGYHG